MAGLDGLPSRKFCGAPCTIRATFLPHAPKLGMNTIRTPKPTHITRALAEMDKATTIMIQTGGG